MKEKDLLYSPPSLRRCRGFPIVNHQVLIFNEDFMTIEKLPSDERMDDYANNFRGIVPGCNKFGAFRAYNGYNHRLNIHRTFQ